MDILSEIAKLIPKGDIQMELGQRIREHRNNLNWNQDELAEKMYVSRQTISNWENDKSYPDIQSLLCLSNLFNVSLDQLVKGDVEKMESIIDEKAVKELNYYSKWMCAGFIITILVTIPLFFLIKFYALIPFGLLYAFTMTWAYKIEKIKKENDIQTYKEIVAFSKGKNLDEISKQREIGKRPYQKIIYVLGSMIITAIICIIIGLVIILFV